LQSLVALEAADPKIIAFQLQLLASISVFLDCDVALLSTMLQKVVNVILPQVFLAHFKLGLWIYFAWI
jgi:hypothetical protein